MLSNPSQGYRTWYLVTKCPTQVPCLKVLPSALCRKNRFSSELYAYSNSGATICLCIVCFELSENVHTQCMLDWYHTHTGTQLQHMQACAYVCVAY